jgi:histidinol-phosphatase (PHP family)
MNQDKERCSMYKADYHTHSSFSPDGEPTIGEMCEAALSAGLQELCVTDHCEVNGWNGKPYDFMDDRYFAELSRAKERYNGRLTLLAGREIGQATQNKTLAAELASDGRLDFVIGSLHNLTGYEDFYFLEYPDISCCKSLAERYFTELRELILLGGFDVLGHLSYPLRYIRGRAGLEFDFSGYASEIADIYRLLINSGKGIEVNTSGLRQPLGQTMPAFDLVKLYRECGGEIVTVGSDAHKAEDIGAGIEEGQDLLRAAGFECFTVFRERKPSFIKL